MHSFFEKKYAHSLNNGLRLSGTLTFRNSAQKRKKKSLSISVDVVALLPEEGIDHFVAFILILSKYDIWKKQKISFIMCLTLLKSVKKKVKVKFPQR